MSSPLMSAQGDIGRFVNKHPASEASFFYAVAVIVALLVVCIVVLNSQLKKKR